MTAVSILAVIPNYVNYLVWSPATEQDIPAALRNFVKRFGFEPQETVLNNNELWVGPAPIPVEKKWAE